MATKKKDAPSEIEILQINKGRLKVCVLGTTPFVCNRMSQKVLQQLLLPAARKKNTAERASTLKHDPYREFRDSPYRSRDEKTPTLIQMVSTAFKKAVMGAALDMPGSSKRELGRWTWVVGDRVNLYGVPKLYMATVRSADMARTPDVRTRAILPRWACYLDLAFLKPFLNEQSIANLIAAAGMLQGVGDGRQEKGAMNYGCFEMVDENNPEFQDIIKNEGRKQQAAALLNPEPFDDETETLLSFFDAEIAKRGVSTEKHKEAA